MTGWNWANNEDVNALFNFFIGSPLLGPGAAEYMENNSLWAPAFFDAGFRPTYEYNFDVHVQGWFFDAATSCVEDYHGPIAILQNQTDDATDYVKTEQCAGPVIRAPFLGAWLWR